jgi:hypothetical protein
MTRIDALDGGLNNKFEPQLLEDIDSPDCQNVSFDDLGAAQTRFGYTQLNTTAVGSFAADGLFTTRFNDGSSTMVAFWNGNGYALGGTSTFTTIPSAQSVFSAAERVDMTMYQNLAFFNMGGQPYKYDGTNFTRQGVPAPNSAPTASGTSAGTLTGDYQYKVSYVNSHVVEGDINTATSTFTAASQIVGLTSLPVAPQSFGVDARKVYRTEAGGTTFKLLTTISDNTTTTFADNVLDADLGATAPTDNGEPPSWNIAKSFQERIFCVDQDANPQLLYYSELGEPFTFGATNFIKISNGDGEKITGLAIHGNSLVIYKENSIWLMYMPDTSPGNWLRVKTDAKYGGIGHRCIVDYEGYQMFLGQQQFKLSGFYSFTGQSVQPNATFLTTATLVQESSSDKIEPDIFTFEDSQGPDCHGVLFKNKIYYTVAKGSGQTTNNRVYVFDFVRRDRSRAQGAWVPWTGINAAMFTIYDSKIYFADSTGTGFVHQLEDGTYTDNGSAIDSYLWTKEFEGLNTDIDFEKDFRFANFTVAALGSYNMGVSHRVDSDVGDGDLELVDLTSGDTLWGTGVWGTDIWGGGVTRKNAKVDLLGKVGKRVQFKFDNRNTAGQGFKVVRGNFYYNRRGLR